MKHLILILAFLTGFVAVSAQQISIRSNETFSAKTWNETLDSADTYTVTLFTETPNEYKAYIKQSIDSIDAPTVTIWRDNKVFEDDSWTRVDTITYTGSADTSWTYSINTATRYRYHRLTFTQTSGSSKIGRTQFKIHNQ